MSDLDAFPHPYIAWEHIQNVAAQVIECVEAGRYCALLGPRFSGKTELLHSIQPMLAQDSAWLCVYVDLQEVEMSTQTGFFASLVDTIAQRVAELTGHRLPIPAVDVVSSAVFRNFLLDSVAQLKQDHVLIIDHLEAMPHDLIQALLTSLRAAHMEQQSNQHRLVAIVSGALSLATLAVGESSPFRGIARSVFIGDPTETESETLITTHIPDSIRVSPAARALLLQVAQGDPYLIVLICQRCVQAVQKGVGQRLTARTVKRLVREFLRREAPHYAPLREAVRLLEEDTDLLRCVLLLLESQVVPKRELPLPLSPDPDSLYLTGAVRKVGGDSYQLRNEIYRRFLADYFDPGRVGHLLTIAGRWDWAIDYLEASIKAGNNQYRSDLLAATINSMYASEDVKRAAHYLGRGLSAAFDVERAHIWLVASGERSLKLVGQVGSTVDGTLPISQKIQVDEDRLEARAFREARYLRGQESNGCIRRAMPLLVLGRKSIGVVTLCEPLAGDEFAGQRERDLQLVGYLAQAARAILEVNVRQEHLARIQDQDIQLDRRARQLSLLHRVSTLIQTMTSLETMLNLILTGITAHFGLGFNRAWLFLLDDNRTQLYGRMGIGEFTHEDAYRTWERAAQVSFDEYVEQLLTGNKLEHTAIDLPMRDLRIPVHESSGDVFSRVVFNPKSGVFWWSGVAQKQGWLPAGFQRQFGVEEALVVPLLAQAECLGIIVVDNKFSPRAYTTTDEEMLATFANQAAVAIVNARQRQQEQRRRELAETLRETMAVMGGSLELEEVLVRILEQMARVLPFDTASIQLLNSSRSALKIIASKGFVDPESVERLVFPLEDKYPNAQVWQRKAPLCFPDIQETFPHFADPKYQVTGVRAWLGAPLLVRNEAIGVITLDSFKADMYTSEHEPLAMVFAGQAAVAIENARLFEQARRRAEDLEALAEVAEEMSATLTGSPPKMLDLILRGACKVTGAECSVLYPFLPSKLVYDTANIVTFGLLNPASFAPKAKLRRGDTSLAYSVVDQDMRVVCDVSTDPDKGLCNAPFIRREAIRAFAGISLSAGKESLGVLFVNFRQAHDFTDEEIDTVRRFANLAAFAILNTRLYQHTYQALQKRIAEMETIEKIDDAISATLELSEILELILDGTLKLTGAACGTVQLVGGDGQYLELVAERGASLASIGERLSFGEGVTGKAAQLGRPYRIGDVRSLEWREIYRPWIPGTRSELAVPMHFEGQVVGVINLESADTNAFSQDDERLLVALAKQAAIAIHNAMRYKELEKTKDSLVASQAVAWLGLLGADWQHTINQKIFSITNYTTGLRALLTKQGVPLEIAGEVLQALACIDRVAESIRTVQFTSPVPSEGPGEMDGQTLIDDELPKIVDRWCSDREDVAQVFALNCPETKVQILPQWLKVAMEKLINNALKAMPGGGQLTLVTRRVGDRVHVVVKDTGRGIPEMARPYFLKRVVPRREGEPGTGMGALVARFVALSHGGDLELVESTPGKGTTLRMILPVATTDNVVEQPGEGGKQQ